MKTKTNLTSRNCEILRAIKAVYNHKIYKKALDICRAEGPEAARAYANQFSTHDVLEVEAAFKRLTI